MSWMVMVPPGGRLRAYLARRASIRKDVEATLLLEDGGGGGCVGAGRFLLLGFVFVAMVVNQAFLNFVFGVC